MMWINPKYITHSHEDGGLTLTEIYLGTREDCMFGDSVQTYGADGETATLYFPETCSRISTALLLAGTRLKYLADNESVPYSETAVKYDRLGRTYIIGRAEDGRYFVHCKLNNGHGFIAEV